MYKGQFNSAWGNQASTKLKGGRQVILRKESKQPIRLFEPFRRFFLEEFYALPPNYVKYQELTIQSSQVAGNLTDYVLYVNLADLSKAGADIFDTCRTDGGDIRVTLNDGVTMLPREIVAIDTAAKTGEMHVLIPGTLSSVANTTLRIYYNGVEVEPPKTAYIGQYTVWRNYAYVLHAKETVGNRFSSTGNRDAVQVGTINSAAGKIGNAADFFNNASNYLEIAHFLESVWNGSNNITLQLWTKTNTTVGIHTLAGRWNTIQDYILYQNATSFVVGGRANGAVVTSTGNTSGVWYKFDVVMNSSNNINLYKNGSTVANAAAGVSDNSGIQQTHIGMNISGSPTNAYDGQIDEIRLRLSALSAIWLTTEYNNQSSPSTFYTTSNEVAGTNYTRALTESLSLTEVLRRDTTKRNTEAVTLTEIIQKAITKAFSETATLTDTVATLVIKLLGLTETITLTELFTKAITKNQTETATLTETLTKQTGKRLGESLILTDSLANQIQKLITLLETLTLVETIQKATTKAYTETLTLTETFNKAVTKRLVEAVTLTDTVLARTATYIKQLLETITASDTVSRIAGYSRRLLEYITPSDRILLALNGINAFWSDLYTDTANAWSDMYTDTTNLWTPIYSETDKEWSNIYTDN